ncbi:hypothetical protein ACWJJH_07675 [Endozoicomonadaceae bacterium StTr2]
MFNTTVFYDYKYYSAVIKSGGVSMSIRNICKRNLYPVFLFLLVVLANELFASSHNLVRYAVEYTKEVKSGGVLIEGQATHSSTLLDPVGEVVVPRVCRALEKEKLVEAKLKPIAKIVLDESKENAGNPLRWDVAHKPVAAETECVVCGKIIRKHLITLSDKKYDVKPFELFPEFHRKVAFPCKRSSSARWQVLLPFHDPGNINPGALALSFWVGYILDGLGLCDPADEYVFHGATVVLVKQLIDGITVISNDCFGVGIDTVQVLLLDRNPLSYRSKRKKTTGPNETARTMQIAFGSELRDLEASHFEFLGFELIERPTSASDSVNGRVVWDLWGGHDDIVSKVEKKGFIDAKRKEMRELLVKGFKAESKKVTKLAHDKTQQEDGTVDSAVTQVSLLSVKGGVPGITITSGASSTSKTDLLESRTVGTSNVGKGIFSTDVIEQAATLVVSESEGESHSVGDVINKSLESYVWKEYAAVVSSVAQ